MAKIVTKDTTEKTNKSTKKSGNTSNVSSVFQREISSEVKGIKNILSSNEKTLKDLQKSLEKLNVKNNNNNGNNGNSSNGSAKSDLHGATEDNEEKKKQAGMFSLNDSIKSMHKDLMGVLGLKQNPKEKNKGEGIFKSLFSKLFSLGNLVKGALAALPIVFKDVVTEFIKKALQNMGVGPELSSKIADYLGPAVQGAALGYALGGWKGALAGAAIAVGYKRVNNMVDKWKSENGDDKVLGFLEIDGLGTLTKSVVTGGALGAAIGGLKGLIAGAVIGAAVGSVMNLVTQFRDTINNPEEQSLSDMFSGLGQGAFYGAITGAVVGSKFGLKGMLIGLAAGGIIGGAAGVIAKLISNFKAKHANDEEYNNTSEISKAAQSGKRFNENDLANQQYELAKLKEKLDNASTDEEKKEIQRKISDAEIDLDTIEMNIENYRKSNAKLATGTKSDWYWYDGKLVDLGTKVGGFRGLSTWFGEQFNNANDYFNKKDRIEELEKTGLSKSEATAQAEAEFNKKRKDYLARRILNSELDDSSVKYSSEAEQQKLKARYDYELETSNAGRAMSLNYQSDAKKEAKLNASIDKTQDFVFESANEQTNLLRQLVELAGGKTASPYPSSPINSTPISNTNFSNVRV